MTVNVSITQRGATSWRVRTRWRESEAAPLQEINETIRGNRHTAEAHKRAILTEFSSGRRSKINPDLIPTFISKWIAYRKAVGTIKATTANHYQIVLAPFVDWFATTSLSGLTADTLRRFVEHDVVTNGAGIAAHRWVIYKAALKSAVKDGSLPMNPCDRLETPKAPVRKKARTLTEAEISALYNESYKFLAAGLAVRVALATGARRGELCALRWQDVTGGVVNIREHVVLLDHLPVITEPKTASSKRKVPVHGSLAAELQAGADKGQANDFILTDGPEPMRPDTLSETIVGIMKSAGIHDLTVHDLRHAHATYLLRTKIPLKAVSARLGHSKVSTTLDTYAHVLPQDHEDIKNAMETLVGPARVNQL